MSFIKKKKKNQHKLRKYFLVYDSLTLVNVTEILAYDEDEAWSIWVEIWKDYVFDHNDVEITWGGEYELYQD